MKKRIFALLIILCLTILAVSALSSVAQEQDGQFSYASIFTGDEFTTSIEENVASPSYQTTASATSGVCIMGNLDQATAYYNNTIDLGNLDENDDLIEFMVLSGGDYAYMSAIDITLTDIYDNTNAVTIRFIEAKDALYHSYAQVSYDGRFMGLSNETGKEGVVWTDVYGTVVRFASLHGGDYQGTYSFNPYKVRFNQEEKQVYVDSNGTNTVVLDLDDPDMVGSGAEWDGFTTNEVNLSITMTLSNNTDAGYIISKIYGQEITGVYSDENQSSPIIRLQDEESFADGMPKGAVGVEYSLPVAYATDLLSTPSAVSIQAIKSGSSTTTQGQIVGQIFTPTEVGDYNIIYSSTNGFGKTTTKQLLVAIDSDILPIVIAPKTELGSLTFNSYYTVPTFVSSGGSGSLTLSEKIYYDGIEVTLDATRTIFIDKCEPMRIVVSAKGYTGDAVVKTFYVPFSDEIAISINDMPKAVFVGDEFEFPICEAYNVMTGEEESVSIYINNVLQSATGITVTEDMLQGIVIKYEIGQEKKVEEYEIAVIQPSGIADYFISSNNLVASEYGVELESSSDSEITTANPIAGNGASLRFYVGKLGFSSMSIVIEDSYNSYNSATISLSPSTTSTTLMEAYGESVELSQSLNDSSTQFNFILDSENGTICDSTGQVLLSLGSFRAYGTYVTLKMNGVYSSSKVIFAGISNQITNVNSFMTGDNKAPAIYLTESCDSTVKVVKDDFFTVISAKAFDVISANTSVSLTLTSPSGTVLYSGNIDTNIEFVGSEYGKYTASYTAIDRSSNKVTENVTFYVYDNITPLVKVTGNIAETIAVGEEFSIPVVTYEDLSECFVQISIIYEFYRNVVENGGTYVFDKAGTYTLQIYVCDESFNVTLVDYTIKVTN